MSEKCVAIQIDNVSKQFRIPTQKKDTIKTHLLKPFQKKQYSIFKALDQVSLKIQKGEFFGIIGKNGSGKSTLLKIIAGIYVPDLGTVNICGKLVSFLELGVGFNPELSGRENIFLNGTILGMRKSYLKSRLQEIIDFSEIAYFIDTPLKNYSSGMQLRLAFSIAIMSSADIYVMDEILAVGDFKFQKKCFDVFQKLKKQGKTIVFVSHNLDVIKKYADRVLFIHNGKQVSISSPEEAEFSYSKFLLDEVIAIANNNKSSSSEIHNKITALRVLNKDQQESKVFKHNDILTIEVSVLVIELQEQMYLRLGIFEKETQAWILDIGSYNQKVLKWKTGKNTVTATLVNNPLYRGDFFIRCIFGFGGPEEKNFFDFFDSSNHNYFFNYISANENWGVVATDQNWQHYWSENCNEQSNL